MNIKSILLVMCLIPMPLFAQEAETLLSGNVTHGGFGGPIVKFADIKNDFGLFVGGRGGWIININPDHAFVLGGGGYGLATDVKADQISQQGEDLYLDVGYGGVLFEYVNRSQKLVHFSIETLIGAGSADFRRKNEDTGSGNGDAFFALEPGVNVILNVAHFFRIGGGVSYRYIGGVNDLDGVGDPDLRGPAAVLSFNFGRF